MCQRECGCNHAAERKSDECRPLHIQRVAELCKLINHVSQFIADLRFVTLAMTEQVVTDHPEFRRECPELPLPHVPIQAEPMNQNDVGPFALNVVRRAQMSSVLLKRLRGFSDKAWNDFFRE